MLPDFPKIKRRENRRLLQFVERAIPHFAPLLDGVPRFTQHEGRTGRIVRLDASEGEIHYPTSEFPMKFEREHMRVFDQRIVLEKVIELAKEIGRSQTKRMLEVVNEAAAETGDVVSAAGGELTKEHLLELFRRVEMDFDPKTLEPTPDQKFVMHPTVAEAVMPKAKEWERDPDYQRQYNELMERKRDEWRDREADRKLVS